MQEGDVLSECEIATLDDSRPPEFDFRGPDIMGKAMVKSSFLREVFDQLQDVPGIYR
jgi:hypothetical protein